MRSQPFFRRLFFTLGVFLLSSPVFLLIGAGLMPNAPAGMTLPLLAALLLALGVRQLPGKLRLIALIVAMALAAEACMALEGWLGTEASWGYAPAILCAVVTAVHLRLLALQWAEAGNPALWYAGMAVYVFARPVAALMRLPQAVAPLRVFALLYFSYVFFALMRQSLWEGMGGGRGPSRAMMARNAGLSLLLTALLLLLTHLPQVAQAFARGMDAVRRLIAWLLTLGRSDEGAALGGGGGGMDFGNMAGEAAGPSLFWVILEKVLWVAAVLLAAALTVLLLRAAVKLLIRAARALLDRLRTSAGAVTDAYEDTVESLLDWGDVKRAVRQRREKNRAERDARTPWDRLTPRQRVRRSYQVYLSRHPEVPVDRTARQALQGDRLAGIYEEARYSSREITAQAAEETRALQKK